VPLTSTVLTRAHALSVEQLEVAFNVRGHRRQVLRGVSFHIAAGEVYGLVGESGCGKSTTAYAALRYLPNNGTITAGRVLIGGVDVTRLNDESIRRVRLHDTSMVYQDPGSALNPTLRIGRQVIECFTVLGHPAGQAQAASLNALRRLGIADPESVMGRYPHQLSGGMQQRVVIAMALACNPRLLVLDEPTTGLDATVEADVLDLLRTLSAESNAAILLIAHNLGVIRSMCNRVGVMYAGKIVEEGPSGEVFDNPRHPYTVGLLRCLPRHGLRKSDQALATIPGTLPQIGSHLPTCVFLERCELATDVCRTTTPHLLELGNQRWSRCHHVDRIGDMAQPPAINAHAPDVGAKKLLELSHISKTFRQGSQRIPALVDVSLDLADGETLGLVGESGSGKSTLAKTLLGIHAADSGKILLDGSALASRAVRRSADEKRAMQIVFQNPDSALNRSWIVRNILRRSVRKLTGQTGRDMETRVRVLSEQLRLTERHLDLKPRQLSGGLKQRVAIARSFAGDPRIVVCDEPTSALDVSVQAAILNQLAELQARMRTSYILISHDLGVVRYLADRIAVMYLGRIMEVGTTDQVFHGPHHPYTEALLSAMPTVDGTPSSRIRLSGEIPSPANPPRGCVFNPRCPRRIDGVCDTSEPPVVEVEDGHAMRCHIPLDELRCLQAKSG
jgi:peptide/nickel transport system ATP-binding protein